MPDACINNLACTFYTLRDDTLSMSERRYSSIRLTDKARRDLEKQKKRGESYEEMLRRRRVI